MNSAPPVSERIQSSSPPPVPSPPVPPPLVTIPPVLTDERLIQLLHRDPVILTEYSKNPFKGNNLSGFDVILQEDVKYCDYINESKNNIIILFDKQVTFIDIDMLKSFIDINTIDDTKIVYRCKNEEIAITPYDTNIVGGPALNMDKIGIMGAMVPLEYLDKVVNGEHQIFVIEPTDNVTKMPIASLYTRRIPEMLHAGLGYNVYGANHCQASINIQVCTISYIENNVLLEECAKKGGNPKKGMKSKTRKGRKDFVTNKGNKYYNRKGKRQPKSRKGKKGKPYSHRK